jgi:hypothetical protein
MQRRGFGYVTLLTLVITFGGAAGMYAIEKPNAWSSRLTGCVIVMAILLFHDTLFWSRVYEVICYEIWRRDQAK